MTCPSQSSWPYGCYWIIVIILLLYLLVWCQLQYPMWGQRFSQYSILKHKQFTLFVFINIQISTPYRKYWLIVWYIRIFMQHDNYFETKSYHKHTCISWLGFFWSQFLIHSCSCLFDISTPRYLNCSTSSKLCTFHIYMGDLLFQSASSWFSHSLCSYSCLMSLKWKVLLILQVLLWFSLGKFILQPSLMCINFWRLTPNTMFNSNDESS